MIDTTLPENESKPTESGRHEGYSEPSPNAIEAREEPELSLSAQLEALLFVAPTMVSPAQLAAALDVPSSQVERELDALAQAYKEEGRGIRVQRHRGRVQLTSAPTAASAIERLLELDAGTRLTRAAVEALAIVMYEQPVTRPQIDAIRGVNSDGVLKNLLAKGLIQELGRTDTPGRPILYGVTSECLAYFGLSSLAELPPLNLESLNGGEDEEAPEVLKG